MSRSPQTRPSARRAALFIDYPNLHARLAECLDAPERAGACITEAARELRRFLADEGDVDTVLAAAYADFGALEAAGKGEKKQGLLQKLYEQDIEPRFAPADSEECALEVQLSVDATAFLHRRSDVETAALMTGDRAFRPLVRAIQRTGAHALVAAIDPPPPGDHPRDEAFMDVLNLLSDETRRDVLPDGETPARRGADGRPPAADHERLDDDMLFRTLEVAEEHFGQYDEVYLTPLLRKLSDVLGERFDPKALVSDLEDAGAVRLEKRRGYPYDYTVLIVDRRHPDVQEMEEQFYGRSERSQYARDGAPASSERSTDGYEEYDEGGPDRY
jgi:uncharacterized LabA/DUF88 family protein